MRGVITTVLAALLCAGPALANGRMHQSPKLFRKVKAACPAGQHWRASGPRSGRPASCVPRT